MAERLSSTESGIVRVASGLFIVSFVFVVLYLGRAVLEPLAIAVLLGFILAPPIRRLRRLHVGRVSSVIIVVVFALGIIAALGFLMENEITRLANELPQYQTNLRQKITTLNNALIPSGALKRASTTLNDLAAEFKDANPSDLTDRHAKPPTAPVPVEVQTPRPPTLEYLQNLVSPLVTPLTMGGLVILFLVFILFYREDLRDRVLRLAGTRDLQRTTEAMNDAGKRLSRFFLIQSAINVSFGVFIGVSLWIVGVPNPLLWGMLAAVLRFVPYIGTPIAAVFPLVLASAIDPGWGKFVATAVIFGGGEIITGQAIEPVLQGQHTGLSPVAIVITTLFWTLIWGAPGLLLAVPITVCIAVLGKHIDALNFLGILLGDEPALSPHEGFYQRVLAGDATEATFQAEERLATEPLTAYYDDVPMKALALAHSDAEEAKLPREKQFEIYRTIQEIVEELTDYSDEVRSKKGGSEELVPARSETNRSEPSVHSAASDSPLVIAARSPLDQASSLLLADVLKKRGLHPSVQADVSSARADDYKLIPRDARLVCITYFGSLNNPAPVRYAIRRLRRMLPNARFLACFWVANPNSSQLEDLQNKVGAEYLATSLEQAAAICFRELSAAASPSHSVVQAAPAAA